MEPTWRASNPASAGYLLISKRNHMPNREKASLNITVPENLVNKQTQPKQLLCATHEQPVLPAFAASLGLSEYPPGEFASLPCQQDSHSPGGPRVPSRDAQSLGGPEAAANPTTAQPELCLPLPAQPAASEHNAHPWTACPQQLSTAQPPPCPRLDKSLINPSPHHSFREASRLRLPVVAPATGGSLHCPH